MDAVLGSSHRGKKSGTEFIGEPVLKSVLSGAGLTSQQVRS